MADRKSTAFLTLGALGAASVAVMLLVSVTRWFLPGVVELSAAFAVAALLGAIALGQDRGRHAARRLIDATSWRALKFAAAGVLVLVLSAVCALFYASFPWPVSLLAGVLIVLFGAADSSTQRPARGLGGRDGHGPLITSPLQPSGILISPGRPQVQRAATGVAAFKSRLVWSPPTRSMCSHRQMRGRERAGGSRALCRAPARCPAPARTFAAAHLLDHQAHEFAGDVDLPDKLAAFSVASDGRVGEGCGDGVGF